MSGTKSATKLKRLVLAQTVAESMAKSQVGEMSAELSQLEIKLEKARESFANSDTSLLFADLHLRHIHGLVERCNAARSRLDSARLELQSETVRQKKLKDRLRIKQSIDQQEEENKLMLERLDRAAGLV